MDIGTCSVDCTELPVYYILAGRLNRALDKEAHDIDKIHKERDRICRKNSTEIKGRHPVATDLVAPQIEVDQQRRPEDDVGCAEDLLIAVKTEKKIHKNCIAQEGRNNPPRLNAAPDKNNPANIDHHNPVDPDLKPEGLLLNVVQKCHIDCPKAHQVKLSPLPSLASGSKTSPILATFINIGIAIKSPSPGYPFELRANLDNYLPHRSGRRANINATI